MNNKHLFLSPELLSRLSFTQPSIGVYYVQALPSHKPMRALPEEIIRQLMVLSLIHQYYYPEQKIKVEHPVQMGRAKKRADVVILGENGGVDIVIEVKQKIDHDSIEQLKSYLVVTGAAYGAAVSGNEFICIKMDSRNTFIEVADIPLYGGSEDISVDTYRSDNTGKISSIAILRTTLQVERFEKIDQAHVTMTIQGHSLNLSVADLASYRKTQKRFMSAGVILTAKIEQTLWLSFVQELLAATPDPVAPSLRTILQIERFEKIDQAHVKMTIQGRSLNLSIADLASYRKTQKRFMSAGVIIITEIEQSVWLSFIQELLAATPNPVVPRTIDDEWTERISAWIQIIPAERNFLTARSILEEALSEPGKNLNHSAAIRIAKAMRSLGWQSKPKRVGGIFVRGYMRNEQHNSLKMKS